MRIIRGAILGLFALAAVALGACSTGRAAPGAAAPEGIDLGTVERHSVRVGDIEIGYKVLGKGRPLLLITGYGATMDLWDPVMLRELSSRRKVILFDNRGMGETTASDRPFSMEQLAEDAAGLLDALKIGKADVMGWSMGTFIAMELALRHSDRVGGLILYAGNCGWKDEGVVPASPRVSADLMDLSGTPEERARRWIGILFPEKWIREHPEFMKRLPRPRGPVSLASVRRQGEAIRSWTGACGRLDKLTHPTLVITGTEDVIVPPANALMLASRIQGAWLIRLPGGHANMYQYPEAFSQCILAFLAADALREDL